jgi:hypothetical protein
MELRRRRKKTLGKRRKAVNMINEVALFKDKKTTLRFITFPNPMEMLTCVEEVDF